MIVSVNKDNNYTFLLKAQLWLGFLFIFGLFGCERSIPYYDIKGNTMGTTYTIRLVHPVIDPVKINSLKLEIDSILVEINRQMSTYILNSEISLFNQLSENAVINISDGFAKVIKRSIHWGEVTSGAFDISVLPSVLLWRRGKSDREYEEIWEPPTDLESVIYLSYVGFEKLKLNQNNLYKVFKEQMIDVNAIAKGWGVDQLFDYLASQKYQHFMVEIGGEVRTKGKNNKGKFWRIGIDKPVLNSIPGNQIYAIAELNNNAMATSGNYRNYYEFDGLQYSHVIDPRTGAALKSDIASVTVTGPNCMDADALATALNVMTVEEGKNLVESLEGFDAYWIIKNQNGAFESIASSGMQID